MVNYTLLRNTLIPVCDITPYETIAAMRAFLFILRLLRLFLSEMINATVSILSFSDQNPV